MEWFELLAIIIIVIFFIGITSIHIYNMKKGKCDCGSSCSGQCGDCQHVCHCKRDLVAEYRKANLEK